MTNRSIGALRPDTRKGKRVSAAPVATAASVAAVAAVAEVPLAAPASSSADTARARLAVPPVASAPGTQAVTVPAPPQKAAQDAQVALPLSRRPRADCTADSAGGLTFDVRLTDDPHAADDPAARTGEAAMLLRRRGGGDGPADAVRLPLGSSGTAGTLRAVLPSIMTLPEGRWDAYLLLAGAAPQRLLPGVHDLRSLIDRVPRQGRTWLGVRIPYATKYGNLTVRSWLRWPHAEAGALRVTDGRMELRGRLYGARLGSTARLEARPRDAAAPPVVVPVTRDGDVHGDGYGAQGESACAFSVVLPLVTLPVTHRTWDLWLRPEEDAEPVRIARILDDVPDKKRIFSYPPQRVSGVDGGDRSVRPYYTLDNDLSVRVSCADAV